MKASLRSILVAGGAALILTACGISINFGRGPAAGPGPAGFPECQADSYDFVGESTLAALGLQAAVPAPLPDLGRVGMIWVTHDLMPHDPGEPGGEVVLTRMLCFQFPDGSGGSEWPVDPSWRPPGSASGVGLSDQGILTIVVLALLGLLVIAASVFAFRRDRHAREV